jgi:predicted small secreted protein
MKKNLLIIAMFVLASTVTINCSKSKVAGDCIELSNKVDQASLTYSTNPSTANCLAYKTAVNNFINCPYVTATEKATLQQYLSLLTC